MGEPGLHLCRAAHTQLGADRQAFGQLWLADLDGRSGEPVGDDQSIGGAAQVAQEPRTGPHRANSERVMLLGRGQRAMEAAFKQVLERLPFGVKELHPDNGSEFFNAHLVRFWKEKVTGDTPSRNRSLIMYRQR